MVSSTSLPLNYLAGGRGWPRKKHDAVLDRAVRGSTNWRLITGTNGVETAPAGVCWYWYIGKDRWMVLCVS